MGTFPLLLVFLNLFQLNNSCSALELMVKVNYRAVELFGLLRLLFLLNCRFLRFLFIIKVKDFLKLKQPCWVIFIL